MKMLVLLLMLSTGAFATERLAPNDPALMNDPTENEQRTDKIGEYAIQSGADRLAQLLDSDPEGIAKLLNQTVDGIVQNAVQALNDHGYSSQAMQVMSDYQRVKGTISARDIGDHAAWSVFLTNLYNELETLLGDRLMKMLHLDDIWYINYCVPVVFAPKNPEWDMVEYRKHFTVLAGIIGYWSSFIACEVISYGSAITLICEPIGCVVEKVVRDYISPPISDRVYKRANGQL